MSSPTLGQLIKFGTKYGLTRASEGAVLRSLFDTAGKTLDSTPARVYEIAMNYEPFGEELARCARVAADEALAKDII